MVYMYQFPCPFVCWWASRLLPCPGYYKECCDEHCGAWVSFRSGRKGSFYMSGLNSVLGKLEGESQEVKILCDFSGRNGGGGLVTKSCPTLCDPLDYSRPGSSVHEILQARILEWVAISFSRGSCWPRNQTHISCIAGRLFTDWAVREAGMNKTSYLSFLFYSLFILADWFTQICCIKWSASKSLLNFQLKITTYFVILNGYYSGRKGLF